ncbi:hypothetical protein SRHO_G00291330 [Serrasalmus rhombeus]
MPREDRATWKSNYFLKIIQLLNDCLKCFIVSADNVDSRLQIPLGITTKITEDALHKRFLEGVRNIASVCLQIGYPTLASIPHSIINGYKRVLAVAVETDYSFPLADKVKAFLADPSAFAAVAAAAPAAEPAKDESEDMGFGLFD